MLTSAAKELSGGATVPAKTGRHHLRVVRRQDYPATISAIAQLTGNWSVILANYPGASCDLASSDAQF